MKPKIAIIFIAVIIFLFNSCASITKNKEQIKSEATSDENASSLTVTTEKESGLIYKPFNPTMPMLIGKDTVYNTIVEKYYKDRIQVVHDTVVKKDTQVIQIDSKEKKSDYSQFMLYGFGFLLILILIGMFWIAKQLPIRRLPA